MDTYFSVSTAQSAASGLDRHEAGAGLKSAGLMSQARYEIGEDMALHAKVVWRRLVGGAAHSPIVDVAGDRDQWQLAIGLSRVFGFGF